MLCSRLQVHGLTHFLGLNHVWLHFKISDLAQQPTNTTRLTQHPTEQSTYIKMNGLD
ncbi:hypothetical protein Hanom_Chr10g00879461 [Helianthus anomalus]